MAAPAEGEQAQGHKLFVGGLPTDVTQEELQMVFQTYGQLEHVHMMPPKSKSGLRCAFVLYTKLESAEDAIKVLDGVYKIREDAEAPIQVRWPREQRNDWGGGDWGKGDKGGKGDWGKGGWGKNDWGKGDWGKGSSWKGGGKDDEGPKLFVGTLPSDVTEQELQIVFTTYGEVKHVHLMQPHAMTGMRCAFVTYAKSESAEDAIKVLDGIYKIRENAENPIQVRWANERKGGGPKGGKDKGYGKGGKDGWGGGYDGGKGGWKGGGDWGWSDGWSGGGGWEGGWGGGKGGGWWEDDWKGGKKGGKKGDGDKGGKDFKGGKDWGWDGGKGGKGQGALESTSGKVYVSNLPEDIQQNAVEYVFGTYGKVEKVHLMSNKAVNGCISAIVEYPTADEAETAIASLHEKYEIRPGYGPLVVRHYSPGKGRSKPY